MPRINLAALFVLALLIGCSEHAGPVSSEATPGAVQSRGGNAGLIAVGNTRFTSYYDGTTSEHVTTTHYDQKGRVTEIDGSPFYTRTVSYSHHGIITEDVWDFSSPGQPAFQTLSTTAVDRRGNPVEQFFLYEVDGVAYQEADIEITYDSRGDAVTTVWRWSDALTVVETRAYDAHRNVVEKAVSAWPGGPTGEVTTYSYNARGILTGYVLKIDTDGDGTANVTDTFWTAEYDKHGNPLRQFLDYQTYGYLVTTVRGPYDEHNNPLQVVEEWDGSFDGTIDYRYETTYRYSGSGYANGAASVTSRHGNASAGPRLGFDPPRRFPEPPMTKRSAAEHVDGTYHE